MEGCEPNCPEYPRDENGYWDNRDMCTDDEEEKEGIQSKLYCFGKEEKLKER